MGRRVKKAVYAYGSGAWELQKETLFVYDGWNLIQEKEVSGTGDPLFDKFYVWGLDLSQTIQGAGGIGGLLCSVESGQTYFFLYDVNGNVGQVVDAVYGSVAAHYEYDSFGNLTNSSGDLADANPSRFSTKYWDDETGLVYYGFRYYAPELGRWLSRDPLGEYGGINLYGYLDNSPINGSDLLGLRFGKSKCDDLKKSMDGYLDISNEYYNDWSGKLSYSGWVYGQRVRTMVDIEKIEKKKYQAEFPFIYDHRIDKLEKKLKQYWDPLQDQADKDLNQAKARFENWQPYVKRSAEKYKGCVDKESKCKTYCNFYSKVISGTADVVETYAIISTFASGGTATLPAFASGVSAKVVSVGNGVASWIICGPKAPKASFYTSTAGSAAPGWWGAAVNALDIILTVADN